jgi:hypothetical protein
MPETFDERRYDSLMPARRLAVLLSLLVVLSSCSLRSDRVESLTVAHSSGGPGPHVVFVTIGPSGRITRQDGTRSLVGKVDAQLASRLIAVMKSPGMQELLAGLRAKGYRSGCCDMEDIHIQLDGVVTEAPVYEFIIDGPNVKMEPALPEELVRVLRRVDLLAESAFGGEHSYPIAPRDHLPSS